MMNNKKIIGSIMLAGALIGVLAGCNDQPSSDQVQSKKQEKILQEGTRQTGMPNITNFNQRKQLKGIYEEVDKADIITYLYTKNDMDGKYIYEGEALGFPIPYSTEYTNPSYISDSMSQGGYAILPQADPDGLFHSQSTQADWIMEINPADGKAYPTFMEPNVKDRLFKEPANMCEPWSLPKGY